MKNIYEVCFVDFKETHKEKNGSQIYCRYSGYQFQLSPKTILDELERRGK